MTTSCNCIADIDGKLEEHSLDSAIVWTDGQLIARTYTQLRRKDNGKPETRSRKPRLFAHSYCPFCGASYKNEPAKPGTSSALVAMLDDPKVAAAVNDQGGGRSA